MTALLLALALAVAPIQPVGFAWEIAPEPPPPAVPPSWWQPFRLDAIHVTLRATEAAAATALVTYQIAGYPQYGWVSWSPILYAPFGAGQTRTLTFSVPYADYAPGPVLFAIWQDCGHGQYHHQGAAIPRPGQQLPPHLADFGFDRLADGAFCPQYEPPNAIFSDGFESGSLRRWVTSKGDQ